jgi:hypothetical protein
MVNNHDQFAQLKKLITSRTTKKKKFKVFNTKLYKCIPFARSNCFFRFFYGIRFVGFINTTHNIRTISLVHYIQALYIRFQKSHGVTNKISVIMNLGMKHVG